TRNKATVDGLAEAWTTQPAKGVPVIAIRDNPHVSETHTQCVERFGLTDPAKCATSRRQAFADFDGTMAAVKRTPGSTHVDMSDYYCTKTTCPAVIGGVMVNRDPGHLTASYVTTLAPYLGEAIRSALRAQGVD
ncbi:MAG: oatA 3, partial [Nocardioidaceae bacterium]|nr:oatA 3 [Nocardioidaceae bacterium]